MSRALIWICTIFFLPQIFCFWLEQDFGATHWYQADGWFTQNTGPWKSSPSAAKPAAKERAAASLAAPACQFSSAVQNTYLAGCASDNCKNYNSLSEAQTVCSKDAYCGGVTANSDSKSTEGRHNREQEELNPLQFLFISSLIA